MSQASFMGMCSFVALTYAPDVLEYTLKSPVIIIGMLPFSAMMSLMCSLMMRIWFSRAESLMWSRWVLV